MTAEASSSKRTLTKNMTMNKTKFICVLACLLTWFTAVRASHWQCNIYGYQYDMTVYASLEIDGNAITASDNYEIAAFCGDECRGVATVEKVTVNGSDKMYYYLRVRSNTSTGEKITFKCYDAANEKEITLTNTLTFTSQAIQGYPSTPYELTNAEPEYEMGDVNGDGRVSITDCSMITNQILELNNPGFIESVSDLNGDGRISITDATMVINKILGNN